MLEKIRRPGQAKAGLFKKIFYGLILAGICLMFIFIGPMTPQLNTQGVVAQVGPHLIRSRELRNREEVLKRQYQTQLNSLSESQLEQIRSRALRDLINTYTVSLLAEKEGFFVTDQNLRETIKSFPAFQEDGRFLNSSYQAYLKSQNLKPAEFEAKIRRLQLGQEWSYVFQRAISSNPLEELKKKERHQYQINFKYAELDFKSSEEEKLRWLVEENNEKGVNEFIKSVGSSWVETGLFSFLSPVGKPIAQNDKVFQAILSHLPEKGLLPDLVRDNNKSYIIKVLSFQVEEAKAEDLAIERLLSQNFGKSVQVFNHWLSVKSQNIKREQRSETQ